MTCERKLAIFRDLQVTKSENNTVKTQLMNRKNRTPGLERTRVLHTINLEGQEVTVYNISQKLPFSGEGQKDLTRR